MQIEVFEGQQGMWYWHFRNKGRVTANGESHISKGKAIRAAKGVVRAVCKPLTEVFSRRPVAFKDAVVENGITIFKWY